MASLLVAVAVLRFSALAYGCQLIKDTFQRLTKRGENWILPLMVPFKARLMELRPGQKEAALLLWILIDGFQGKNR